MPTWASCAIRNIRKILKFQQLLELQEPEAGFMLAVGLDFGKQSKSQLRLPLTQPQCFITSTSRKGIDESFGPMRKRSL